MTWQADDKSSVWVRRPDLVGSEAIASTQYTTSTNTAAIAVPSNSTLVSIFMDANETMDIAVEWSPDGGTTWVVPDGGADTFGQMTQPEGAQAVGKQFTILAPHYRLS
jgi:hypothetical protein